MIPRIQLSPSRSSQLTGILLVNLATLSWATNIILGRWLRDDIGPLTLAAARFLIAAPCLALLLRRRPAEERRVGPEDMGWLLGMALSGVVIFGPALYLGLRYTTAVNVTLINGLGPLLTGLLASILIQEPMSRRQVGGAVIGLAGVGLLISGGASGIYPDARSNLGGLIVLGALMMWGIYSVLSRQVMRRHSSLFATAYSAFLGLPILLLAAAWELWARPIEFTLPLLLSVVYIGLVPTVIGFFAWNEGVRRLGPSGAMVFYNTLPLYGAFLGYLVLGESIGVAHLVGGSLIIGGGLWAAGRRSLALEE